MPTVLEIARFVSGGIRAEEADVLVENPTHLGYVGPGTKNLRHEPRVVFADHFVIRSWGSCIVHRHPRTALAQALAHFFKLTPPKIARHENAYVDATAHIGAEGCGLVETDEGMILMPHHAGVTIDDSCAGTSSTPTAPIRVRSIRLRHNPE